MKTYEYWLKYYENVTKEQVIEDSMYDIEEITNLQQENKQLKEKINKAIDYIKTHSEMTDLQICGIENVLAFRGSATKLLEILEGDKENE